MNEKKKTEELVVIQKLFDYLVWVSPLINRLPRDRKFTIGDRVLNRLYDVLEDLIKAKYRRSNKLELLERANVNMEIVRFYHRLILKDNLWDRKRYKFASESINEVGKILGNWARQVNTRLQSAGVENQREKK